MNERVAIIGAGLVGSSFALLMSQAGVPVVVYDRDPKALVRSEELVADSCGVLGLAVEAIWNGIRWTESLDDALAGATYVQECVPEHLELKRQVFAQLDELTDASVVLASSVALYPMSEIAVEVTRHPERCVVVHPTNPPHLLRFCEIVPTPTTDPQVVTRALALMEHLGQHPVLCRREVPGFILNRLQFALTREAFHLLRAGVADVAAIDAAITEGLGPRWAALGPFAVEEVNGESIGASLHATRDTFDALMSLSAIPYEPLTDHDIEAAGIGLDAELSGLCRGDLVALRDSTLLAVRALKQAHRSQGEDAASFVLGHNLACPALT